jgi:hypothetical protein
MMCKISKSKTNPYIISAIAIFFAVYISGFLYYYYFSAYPATVYAQQQSKDNFNDISKRPTAAVNSTSQGPEPQIAVPSISTKDLNNTSDIQSSEVDDKYVEELFEAEPEDNTETGSENIDNEKMDEKQGTKNLEEKGDNKQVDRDQQRESSDESAGRGPIAEEEKDIRQKPEKGDIQGQADNTEKQENEKKLDETRGRDTTDSDKGGEEQKTEDRDEIEVGEEDEIEEGEEDEIEEGEEEEPKDTPSDDTPLELPFP